MKITEAIYPETVAIIRILNT